jgi:hypothetical protein
MNEELDPTVCIHDEWVFDDLAKSWHCGRCCHRVSLTALRFTVLEMIEAGETFEFFVLIRKIANEQIAHRQESRQ